ncbi:hypothetical protein [Aminobacter sp. Piv2-1]|uniref:hypothetical protein n=1 Tax=Aminobacter sp. Piv2-1 TaxID=3031122 RepID=UPI0030A8CAAF
MLDRAGIRLAGDVSYARRAAPANDDRPEAKAERREDIAPWVRLDRVAFDIARLIGRQMAREDLGRLRAANGTRLKGE